jgi:soluble lytic murein transglycosylase-like protein
MQLLLIRTAALAIAMASVIATAAAANSGAMLPSKLVSGERVVWVPEELDLLLRSLDGEIRDPAKRAELAQIVHSESRALRIDPLYVLAIMKVESGFRADVVSPRGAVGLLQVKPRTARSVAQAEARSGAVAQAVRLEDPKTNVALGLRYLRQLEDEFSDPEIALAAYNMGPTLVRNRLEARQPVPRGYAQRVRSAYRALRAGSES